MRARAEDAEGRVWGAGQRMQLPVGGCCRGFPQLSLPELATLRLVSQFD